MATNKERREATRASIVSAAREHFAEFGYEETRTDSVLERAGVSRGALYHHFPGKRELFEAVYTAVVKESIEQALRDGRQGGSPLEDLILACNAWLRAVRKAGVAAILLQQGPQVLGWKRAREIEGRLSLAPMRAGIERACAAGQITVDSIDVTALLINAMLAELALISLHRRPRVSVAVQEASVRQFIEGLGA